MNKNQYRLIFSRVRNMLIAVEETAGAAGNAAGGEAVCATECVAQFGFVRFTLRRIALAALIVAGVTPMWAVAQIVGGGPHAPSVIQTQSGIPQVNINKPTGGGVSLNTYNQFDVQKPGIIVNNSPVIVNTQQAGFINGNPNFGPNDAARIIVNQVNSPNVTQIRGAIEIAGSKAQLVIANPSGVYLDGAGFINTSRAVITSGVPFYGPDGSLAGYNVSKGLVTVAGSGLNAANVDAVDILARAVQANAAIYAKNLRVVTGPNQVNHDTLAATPIQGDGPAPTVAVDVAQLGGMYADRILLIGTERGLGVSNAGVIAAQAGDLIPSSGRPTRIAGQDDR
ncbi:filamentous hemagglutinin N-terminal domain-containing protein [Burkholderia cenocepacia]|uniref:two-partner secretion domain-containing protein n=1 Tax=Burkholderia cenocepacia TaxID=95486 RepID=UPI002011479B|nr:filamentous hemagglutinin N-terminal domain-containing protein [Burkholderia cenocepacia]